MRIAFFAATPFQVFNCINIYKKQYENVDADIFILTFAVDMSELVYELRRWGVFDDVYVLDKINKIPGKYGVVKDFIFTNRKNRNMLMRKKYDIMFTTYIGDRNNLYYNTLLKQNYNLKVYFYDEGIGIYTVGYYKSSDLMKKFYKCIGMRYINENFAGVYVYVPKCICSTIGEEIIKIPSVDKKDLPLVELYNNVFWGDKQSSDKYNDISCIYLDQDFSRYLSKEEYDEGYKFSHQDFLNVLKEKIQMEKIVVKKHPIRKDVLYEKSGYNVEKKTTLPWEIVLLNSDFSDKILVGISSTALLTPKMIYDEEPYVIVLGKMIYNEGLCDKVWSVNIEQLFKRVQQAYINKNKFVIVESISQFKEVVDKFAK